MNLKHLTDKTLLEDIKMLVAHERVFLTKILHHLKEVEDRKLFSDLKYSSIFDYTVKELGYSEAAAMRRIQSARLLKQMPGLEKKIESGALSLTNLSKAEKVFKDNKVTDSDEKRNIIKRIENKSSRECEKELISLTPAQPLPKEQIKPITKDFNQLKVNISDSTLNLLNKAKSLLGFHQINNEFIEKLTLEAIESTNKKKFKLTLNPRKNSQNPDSRTLSHQTKRDVYEKSHGVCENCGSLFMLEFDHVKAFSLGGASTSANLRLLCFQCNQRARIRARL